MDSAHKLCGKPCLGSISVVYIFIKENYMGKSSLSLNFPPILLLLKAKLKNMQYHYRQYFTEAVIFLFS